MFGSKTKILTIPERDEKTSIFRSQRERDAFKAHRGETRYQSARTRNKPLDSDEISTLQGGEASHDLDTHETMLRLGTAELCTYYRDLVATLSIWSQLC